MDDETFFRKRIKEAYKINRKFFGFDIKFKVILVYNKKDFDKKFGKKTLKWVCAAARKGKIIIFAPSVLQKKSGHKLSEYEDTLIHELSHLFYRKLAGTYKPLWVSEGIALYLEKKFKTKKKKIKDALLLYSFPNKMPEGFYENSYLAIKTFIRKNGKKKLLEKVKKGLLIKIE